MSNLTAYQLHVNFQISVEQRDVFFGSPECLVNHHQHYKLSVAKPWEIVTCHIMKHLMLLGSRTGRSWGCWLYVFFIVVIHWAVFAVVILLFCGEYYTMFCYLIVRCSAHCLYYPDSWLLVSVPSAALLSSDICCQRELHNWQLSPWYFASQCSEQM